MRNRAVQYVNGADSDEPDLLHDGPPKATCLVHGALPPDDDLYFYRWAGDVRSRRRLKITAFFHALGAAAHGSAMIATLYWARMEIYVNVTRQEIYRVDSDALSDVPSNATPSWSRRDVLYVRWHPSWVIFTFFALSFTFHLVEGASLLGFLCCVAVEKNQIVADLLTWWNRWYVVSLYRCCTPTRYVFIRIEPLHPRAHAAPAPTVLCLATARQTTRANNASSFQTGSEAAACFPLTSLPGPGAFGHTRRTPWH